MVGLLSFLVGFVVAGALGYSLLGDFPVQPERVIVSMAFLGGTIGLIIYAFSEKFKRR